MTTAVLLKFFKGEISPFDESALECALSIPDNHVILLAMAPLSIAEKLRYFSRLGAERAILLSDPAFAGSDTLATAKTLACALKKLSVDLILCGRQSMDGDTAQVPPEISTLLDMQLIAGVMDFSTTRVLTRAGAVEVCYPCVMSLERICPLRYPSLRSKPCEIEIWDRASLGLKKEECGLLASPTRVISIFGKKEAVRSGRAIRPDMLPEVIEAALKKESVTLPPPVSERKLKSILVVGQGLSALASSVAEQVIRINKDTPTALARAIRASGVRYVLFRADFENRNLAPQVAALLEAGLAADCIRLESDGEELFVYRPAMSGNTVAKIQIQGPIAMATVRERTENAGELIYSLGAGAIDQKQAVTAAAKKRGAMLTATRKVIDMGGLPYECQVGLTGKIVTPRVYVALGISGEVQHTVGMENAGTVIAVNPDRDAKIFRYADYAVYAEIKDVIPYLS